MGRKRQSTDITGKDMANRCYDTTLSFLLQTLPLTPTVRGCVTQQLADRWLPIPSTVAPTSASAAPTASAIDSNVSASAYSYAATASAGQLEEISEFSRNGENTNSSNSVDSRAVTADEGVIGMGKSGMSSGLSVFFEGLRKSPEDADLAGPGHGCLVAQDFEP